jgi:hyperosmotically inducible protein
MRNDDGALAPMSRDREGAECSMAKRVGTQPGVTVAPSRSSTKREAAMRLYLVVGAVALVISGCGDQKNTAAALRTPAAPQSQTGPANGGAAAPNDRLVREVRHEIVMLPYYGVFDDISYRVDGDTVTLFGHVTRPTLKSDVENSVKRVEGVARVVNNIEVLPPSPNDDRIRQAVYRAVYGFPSLNRYALAAVPSIHIISNGGRVTLTGVVDSEADKNTAEIQAKSVSGVFSVTNELQVAR